MNNEEKQHLINNVCEWLDNYIWDYYDIDSNTTDFFKLIEDIRKYMEEEL